MPDTKQKREEPADLGALLGLLPLDILESVIVSLLKVFGEQPAIEALLDLSTKVAENNLQTQNLLNQQSMLHNLTVAGTVKCLEMVLNIDPRAETAPNRLRDCLKTIEVFKVTPEAAASNGPNDPETRSA